MFNRFTSILKHFHKAKSFTSLELSDPDLDSDDSRQSSRRGESEPPQSNFQSSRPTSPATGITFSVDKVAPAKHPLWLSTLGESLELRCGNSIVIMPEQSAPALAAEGYYASGRSAETNGDPSPAPVRSLRAGARAGIAPISRDAASRLTFVHPLIEAVHLAFSSHRPLVLSPDSIWLTIVQGFGHHVHENAEGLRGRIVQHEGQKELQVVTESLHPDHWPDLISQFSSQIRENSDPVLYETLLCAFSTTTPAIRTAYEVALMDAYSRYFQYTMQCVCGIPSITLEGTPNDWQRMRDRLEVLATYNLDWWTSRLAPILDEFIATAEGAPDRRFWQSIYKPQQAYVSKMATGWITDLFPYLGTGPTRRRNHVFDTKRTNWLPPNPGGGSSFGGVGVRLDDFPCGLSKAPVKLQLPDASQKQVDLVGGFIGVSQRAEDNALSPIIGWAVVEQESRSMAEPPRRKNLVENTEEKEPIASFLKAFRSPQARPSETT